MLHLLRGAKDTIKLAGLLTGPAFPSQGEAITWLLLVPFYAIGDIRRQVCIRNERDSGTYRLDFVVLGRIVVEYDGHPAHGGRHDQERDRRIRKVKGWPTVRIKPLDLANLPVFYFKIAIGFALSFRRVV